MIVTPPSSTRLKTNSTRCVVYESNYEPYGPGCGETDSEEYRYTGKRGTRRATIYQITLIILDSSKMR
jgi:hypothetical protein